MNKHVDQAIRALKAARPASGFRPQTEEEWIKLQRATVEMNYALLRSLGKGDREARSLASLLGGDAGRMLLDLAFREAPVEKPSGKSTS